MWKAYQFTTTVKFEDLKPQWDCENYLNEPENVSSLEFGKDPKCIRANQNDLVGNHCSFNTACQAQKSF